MASPEHMRLADLKTKYAQLPSDFAFTRLYEDDSEFSQVFSVLHEKLNGHFDAINDRASKTRHYWAESSRDLIALTREIRHVLFTLKQAGAETTLVPAYQAALESCRPWLKTGGGSTVPEGFTEFDVIRYEPVFRHATDTIKLDKQRETAKLTMVGEGSYALVYSYVDEDYDKKFAVKRAKRGIDERDMARFKQEFVTMAQLSFPYVVEVYRYDDERNEYRMEFCDEHLRGYIARRNSTLPFSARKRIALQFLYGLNYIHSKGLLHRDISLQNVLLRLFDKGAVLVKLSDFGLVKDRMSEFTRTHTELRGTLRDPLLENFRDYNETNEIYAIGCVLSYIFTGKESLKADATEVSRIVQRCVNNTAELRYGTVLEVIADVEALDSHVNGSMPAEASTDGSSEAPTEAPA